MSRSIVFTLPPGNRTNTGMADSPAAYVSDVLSTIGSSFAFPSSKTAEIFRIRLGKTVPIRIATHISFQSTFIQHPSALNLTIIPISYSVTIKEDPT